MNNNTKSKLKYYQFLYKILERKEIWEYDSYYNSLFHFDHLFHFDDMIHAKIIKFDNRNYIMKNFIEYIKFEKFIKKLNKLNNRVYFKLCKRKRG